MICLGYARLAKTMPQLYRGRRLKRQCIMRHTVHIDQRQNIIGLSELQVNIIPSHAGALVWYLLLKLVIFKFMY